MEGDDKRSITLRCALVLNEILKENKALALSYNKKGIEDLSLIFNLSQLSSATGLRPATVSNIFNGDSNPSALNLILILQKLNRSITDFGTKYDGISTKDIINFEKNIASKKESEKLRKSSK